MSAVVTGALRLGIPTSGMILPQVRRLGRSSPQRARLLEGGGGAGEAGTSCASPPAPLAAAHLVAERVSLD